MNFLKINIINYIFMSQIFQNANIVASLKQFLIYIYKDISKD